MSYLGVLEGARFRLEGGDRKAVPSLSALLGTWDGKTPDRSIGLQTAALVDAALRRNSTLMVGKVKVPIYWFDGGGASFKALYPALAFDIIGTTPRYNEFVYQSDSYRGDMYQNDIPTSAAEVFDGSEDVGSFPRMTAKRPVEHPLDVMLEIRAYAKDPLFMGFLEEYVYQKFTPRDFLRVPMRDGSYRSWDVIFKDSNDLDKREAVRAATPGVEREYAKVWTYTVEGYFDNTDKTELVNLVQKRTITQTAL